MLRKSDFHSIFLDTQYTLLGFWDTLYTWHWQILYSSFSSALNLTTNVILWFLVFSDQQEWVVPVGKGGDDGPGLLPDCSRWDFITKQAGAELWQAQHSLSLDTN